MKKTKKTKKNKSKGQSLVELAISLVFILFLLEGAVEFSIAFFEFVELRDAAQEGALYGSVSPGDIAGIEARARCAAGSIVEGKYVCGGTPIDLTSPEVRVGITFSGGMCEGYNNSIKVTLLYDHKIFMPILPWKTIPLRAEVTDTILSGKCQSA